MTIKVKVIADSISPAGKRITTVQKYYPRIIHAEEMTHRAIAKSASGSRAIPVEKVLANIKADPFVPSYWGVNQRGMSAKAELKGWRRWLAKKLWLTAGMTAVEFSKALSAVGLHKQIANRITEPWMHIHVVETATEWDNYFSLRISETAEPHMRDLALATLNAMNASVPKKLGINDWHLPYVLPEEADKFDVEILRKISVARCARVSYAKHGTTTPNVNEDMGLFDMLFESRHMTPFEHQAKPLEPWQTSGPFVGWEQFRKTIKGECFVAYEPMKKFGIKRD